MQTRLIKLRFRRRIRKGQRQVEDLGNQAERQIEKHLFKRFERLMSVKRFVAGWLGLMALMIGLLVVQNVSLNNYYQTLRTVPGGVYQEGVLGRFTNANPIYATSDADVTVSRLVFSGLLTYDQEGKLTGDLAQNYEVDAKGTTYTVRLKSNLKWHDGKPLTSRDVLFTYQLIQNPDVQSPLRNSWQGIEVSAPDDRTVVFELPGVLASFPYSMTNGIVPEHLLAATPRTDLRSADFNTVRPIGAGPFVWQAVEAKGDGNPRHAQQQIGLTAFDNYQAGAPKLQQFVVNVFADKQQLIDAFTDNQLTGVEGLSEVPQKLDSDPRVISHNLPLRAANMVFFKTTQGVLSNAKVRQALVQAADTPSIARGLDYPARLVREPILPGQPGYEVALAQAGHNLKAAQQVLEGDGWKPGKDGVLQKDNQKLVFSLTAADTQEYRYVAKELRTQWKKIGVKLNVQFLNPADFQSALNYHSYESILYGIAIGSDPDVFVYWDSSQADIRSSNRLNLSEYSSASADAALEAGRTRLDPSLRAIKYRPFLQAWQADNPALGLYQPRLLYLTNGPLDGLSDHPINTPVDRLANVHNWQIRQARVTNP